LDVPDRRPRRRPELTRGEAIAAAAAILLFAFMFFDWYGSEVAGQAREIRLGGGSGAGGNAWQTLDLIPLVLLLTVVVTVGTALLRIGGSKEEPPVPLGATIAVLGGLSALLVLFRILVPPDLGDLGGIQINATIELGAYLGLTAACGIAYGGYRAMGERGTSFAKVASGLASERRRRPRQDAPKRQPPRERRAWQKRSRSSSD
jgi:hypothetical protein